MQSDMWMVENAFSIASGNRAAARTFCFLILALIFDHIFSIELCIRDSCLVVAAQGFIIRSQDNLPFSGMGYNARLQVIADKTRGNPAEEPIHVDVGADKAVHLHVPAWFHVGVLAVGQCPYLSLIHI